MAKREFTALYQKKGKRYIAWVEEIPGVNTQGRTLAETKKNLQEALRLIMETNRALARKHLNKGFRREELRVAVPA